MRRNVSTDPLGSAITVLGNVKIENPSARMDTEDAHDRVNLALEYLRMVTRAAVTEREMELVCQREDLRQALADALAENEELRGRLRLACEPCAECGHVDYRELDDIAAGTPSEDTG